jgi:glycerol-3-phosphate acyltransferase PlsY
MTYLYQLLFLVFTYFVAAIPFGLVLAKLFGKQDIREAGSGNIGATNVTRVLGKRFGLATLILDGIKGALMVILARYLFADAKFLNVFLSLVGAISVLAHIFPIYLQFKGGKGVATTLAVLLAINPTIGLVSCAAWIIIFAFTRTSAIASLASILITVCFTFYYNAFAEEILLTIFLAAIIFVRHKENISRILKGEESKFGK